MKSQLTSKNKQALSFQDAFFVLFALVLFMIAMSLYSAELIEIVQQIEAPNPDEDELLTAVSSMR